MLVNAVLGAALVLGNRTLDRVERVPVRPGLLQPAEPRLPLNILVVGSDSRADLDTADQRSFGTDTEVKGQRSDTMMLVHADPRTGQVGVLSIPRDLYVPLSGFDRSDRINMAFFEGGHDALIATIQDNLGVRINHFVEVDFVGFRDVVDAVGGVPVFVPNPARDRVTGLDVPGSGCVTLKGDQALAYVRSRHYQELVNGRWRTDPTSDFGRIKRQQGFIRHTLERAVARGARNPARLNSLLSAVLDSMRIDDAFSRRDIARLANQLRSVDPDAVRTYVVPTFPDTVNGAAVLRLDADRIGAVLNRFSGFAAFRPTPRQVRVRVAGASPVGPTAGITTAATPTTPAPTTPTTTTRRRRSRAVTAPTSTIPTVPPSQRTADAAAAVLGRIGFVVVPPGAGLAGPVPTGSGSAVPGSAVPAPAVVPAGAVVIRHRPESLEHARLLSAWFDQPVVLIADGTLAGVDAEIELPERFTGVRPTRKTGVEEDVNDEAIGRRCDDAVVSGGRSPDAVVGG